MSMDATPTTDSESAALKVRAETVNVPSRVSGLDGAGWTAKVLADPMRTLPPGAGYLIVTHLQGGSDGQTERTA